MRWCRPLPGHCGADGATSSVDFYAGEVGEVVCFARVRLGSDGRFEMPIVLAGRGRVGRMQERETGGTVGPVGEVQVDVPMGGALEVEVP